jgi:FtsP/CotA-like multicopper oxidase with cupredoxin domain
MRANIRFRVTTVISIFLLSIGAGALAQGTKPAKGQTKGQQGRGQVREYYIAAEQVEWDYAPSGLELMHGAEVPYPWGLHRRVTKTRYTEFTDATFAQRKAQPEWLGILGPIIRAEVGDTVVVHFRNLTGGYHSIHVHGLRYDKQNEGAIYANNLPGIAVPPGGDFTYHWLADAGSGPPAGQSSRLWLYHGHVNEPDEINSGLIGPVIVTARGRAKADGSPVDVDREFVVLFMVFDQLKGNEERPSNSEEGLYHAMNGYIFSNLPGLVMNEGEHVRWYLAAMGNERDIHSAHWHGKTVTRHGRSEDVIPLVPAQTEAVDMLADNPGTWMFQCHVDEHLEAGMMATYRIRPAHPRSCPVQFGDANFWSGESSFQMQLKNLGEKPIQQLSLESDIVIGLNHLNKVQESWKVTLPLGAKQSARIEMPKQMPHTESILGWVVYPLALKFADGTQWSPQERGECMRIYWRDAKHPNMDILPPVEMPAAD